LNAELSSNWFCRITGVEGGKERGEGKERERSRRRRADGVGYGVCNVLSRALHAMYGRYRK
jgi:hypothetical protein